MKITATVSFAGHEIAMAFGETREVADEMATLLVRDGLAIEVATEDKTPAAPVDPPKAPAPKPPEKPKADPKPKASEKPAESKDPAKPQEPAAPEGQANSGPPEEQKAPEGQENPGNPEDPKGPETTDSTEGQNPEQTQQS